MSRLVDHEALVLDLKARLRERPSWGRPQLLDLLAELEQTHRIDETADAAVLRRFGDHLHDTFLDLVPSTATTDPLAGDDRDFAFLEAEPTSAGMDDGAASDHPSPGGDECPPPTQPKSPAAHRSSRPTPVSRLVEPARSMVVRAPAPATT